MASSSFSPSANCFSSTTTLSAIIRDCSNQKLNLIHNGFHDYSSPARFPHLILKAAKNDRNTKPNSVICGDCDGNGAVVCSQCKGKGVNAVDFFNGQFKAGESCWLCGTFNADNVSFMYILSMYSISARSSGMFNTFSLPLVVALVFASEQPLSSSLIAVAAAAVDMSFLKKRRSSITSHSFNSFSSTSVE
ncbi:uncharacterized protein LOC101218754 isoform X1 [Cucumis sativus]|uniref:uncharacterized protein LOC101218754 isoform X1 n=1 Tax=Cucumis sativus TaxID=3659 RepID=UPI0012F4D7CE|nr:uncharacterized protein LOC101218754 isoform X1 [Cucumis sativus]